MKFLKKIQLKLSKRFFKFMAHYFSTSPGQKIILGGKTFILIEKREWYPPAYPDMKAVLCTVFDPTDKRSHRADVFVQITPLHFISLVSYKTMV